MTDVRQHAEPIIITADATDATATDWRHWVLRHRAGAALLAGLVGTQMATIVGYFMPGFGLPLLDWNMANGMVYTPDASPFAQFWTGGFFHYLDGFVFTAVFVFGVHPLLPWRNTTFGNMAKALVWGTLLAFISVAFMTPRVYAPAEGYEAGFFSLNFGWSFVIAVFIWHWVYAIHIGLIYNPAPEGQRRSR